MSKQTRSWSCSVIAAVPLLAMTCGLALVAAPLAAQIGNARICRSPSLAIPDNNATGVSSSITLAGSGTVSNVDVSIARYRAGEAPILEVTDALTTLAQQRLNLQQALFDFEVARAQLQEAAGR